MKAAEGLVASMNTETLHLYFAYRAGRRQWGVRIAVGILLVWRARKTRSGEPAFRRAAASDARVGRCRLRGTGAAARTGGSGGSAVRTKPRRIGRESLSRPCDFSIAAFWKAAL